MPKKKVSADEVVKSSMRVFWKQGYHQTSMNDLAEACGLQKASLYHHFPKGKEQIMEAVLELLYKGYKNSLFAIAYDESMEVKEKLNLFKEFSYKTFFDASDGCLMGNIALETVSMNENFALYFRKFFNDWIDALANVFKTRYTEEEAILQAKDAVAQVEGAVMLMKVFQDKSYLERALENIADKFNLSEIDVNNSLDLKKAQSIFEQEPVSKAYLFGSFARGEQTENSDIDILIEFSEGSKKSLFIISRIQAKLEDSFNRKVDLVPSKMALRAFVKEGFERDKILIYDR